MLKGKEPRKPQQDVPPQLIDSPLPETEPTNVGNGGTGNGGPAEKICWEFAVSRGTEALTQAVISQAVSGSIVRGDIMLLSQNGVLGFVPPKMAKRILSAYSELSKGRLEGRVTKFSGPQVWVELCLMGG